MAENMTTVDGMRVAIDAMENGVASNQAQLNAVDGQVRMVESTWTGQAALNFVRAYDAWRGDAASVLSAMSEMIGLMNSNLGMISETEDENVQVSSNLLAALTL